MKKWLAEHLSLLSIGEVSSKNNILKINIKPDKYFKMKADIV